MSSQKKLGFYHYSPQSNKRLIRLFEKNQKIRCSKTLKDWKNKQFIKELQKKERQARKEILIMLQKGKVRTSDDFYRAAWFFHHGNNFRAYALAVTLTIASYHLGELWGKSFYAVALDRFLLSAKQRQYFGTQLKRKRGKRGGWQLSPYNPKTTDRERKEYFVEPLSKALKRTEEFEQESTGK